MTTPNSTTEAGIISDLLHEFDCFMSHFRPREPELENRLRTAFKEKVAAALAQSRQPSAQGGGIPPLNSVVGYDDSGTAHSLEVLFCDSTPAGLRVAVQLATPPATSGMKEAVPDDVWEALQRLIENGGSMGPASREDALLVAKHRRFLMTSAPPTLSPPDTGNVGAIPEPSDDEVDLLLAEIDQIARNYDHHDYGLPTHDDDSVASMRAQVQWFFESWTRVPQLPLGRGMVPMTEDAREFIGEVADDTALNSELRDWAKRILATIAPAKRMLPLTPESIKRGIDADPTALTQGLVTAFCRGVRFAEQSHGIKEGS